MTIPQKNTALLFAIIVGLISLPLTWLTIQGAKLEGPLDEFFNQGMVLNITGINGYITVLFQTPIWLIVGLAIIASLLQLMSNSRLFAVPPVAKWFTAIAAVMWISFAIILPLFSDQTTSEIGSLIGFISAVVPLFCLFIESTNQQIILSSTDNATNL